MTIAIAIVALAVCLSATMAGAWLAALRTGRCGWIDAIWSFATGLFGAAVALVSFADTDMAVRQVLVAVLALLWSLRLGIHIATRTARGGDDPRYGQLREEWGDAFNTRLFWFLQIQALAALVLALSIMLAAHNPMPGLRTLDWLGVAILILLWQTIGTRHPNYFFEWLGWLAYAIVAVDLTGAYPQGWLAFAGPLLMYWLLVHASGIPPLEAHMLRSRGKAFREYQKRINAFWPGRQHAIGEAGNNGSLR